MVTGERTPAQARVALERPLLNQLADRTEPPVLQMAYIEVSMRRNVLRPTQELVTRRLHDTLTLDHPPALVAVEFRSQPLEHGPAGFLDLQEQRCAVAAHVERDCAKRANAADADRLEGDVLERISIDEAKPIRRQPAFIGGERALGVDVMAGVALDGEMIDQRWPIRDARLLALHQTREVIVFREMVACLGEDTLQLAPERGMLDALDLARELDLAVPDFQWGKLCQVPHPAAIGLDRSRRDRAGAFFREVRRQTGDRDARRQALEIGGEIHA